jgi:hypothetical protein
MSNIPETQHKRNTESPCRRQCPRVFREVMLLVTRLQYPMTNLEAKSASTKNLSEKGLCFFANELYEAGSILQLAVDLRGWQHYLNNIRSIVDTSSAYKPLTAVAEVMWSRELTEEEGKGYEMGVQFKDIYEDDLMAFKQYLDRLLNP